MSYGIICVQILQRSKEPVYPAYREKKKTLLHRLRKTFLNVTREPLSHKSTEKFAVHFFIITHSFHFFFQQSPAKVPDIPDYNPLDKDNTSLQLRPASGKTKKLPYSKEDTVTTKGLSFFSLCKLSVWDQPNR